MLKGVMRCWYACLCFTLPPFYEDDSNPLLVSLSGSMHPLGLCNNNDEEDLYEYGWVGVVKLEQPELDPSCLTVLGKRLHVLCNGIRSWEGGLFLGSQQLARTLPLEVSSFLVAVNP
ncbi:UNVERIFIED_CONTAM: hypothetical protein FKN15_002899 [Acipenser sinensis]